MATKAAKPPTAPKLKKKTRAVTLMLPCELSDAETLDRARRRSALAQKRQGLERELRAVSKNLGD